MIYTKKIMGLDVGDKRIGIAFSDALRITAQGYETYTRQSESEDVAHIKELFLQQNAESIVCGLPKNMNGTIGPQAEKVRAFAALVEEAVDSLAQAKAMHDELEGLYHPYVDFGRGALEGERIAGEVLALA